ncbi:hypothetical protein Tco_0863364, partial [Tanacetum coccineum]
MNPQETQQVVARDEKWVPSAERVKISSSNIRLETNMSHKSLGSNSDTPSRRTILNICLRVEGVDFTDVPYDDIELTFLIDLGYKGPLNRHTNIKRRVKKKVTLSADENIISDDPDATLELDKSISQTKAEEADAASKVHATHARIVTESVPESAKKRKSGGRSSKSVVIQDTPSAPKSKPATSKTKLKGAPSLTPQEQEAADIMQALKESKKTSRRQP